MPMISGTMVSKSLSIFEGPQITCILSKYSPSRSLPSPQQSTLSSEWICGLLNGYYLSSLSQNLYYLNLEQRKGMETPMPVKMTGWMVIHSTGDSWNRWSYFLMRLDLISWLNCLSTWDSSCYDISNISIIMQQQGWVLFYESGNKSRGSFTGLYLELVLELYHHSVIPLLHLINLLDLLGDILFPLLQVLLKVYLHQVLDVLRQLLDYGVQGLDELLDPALYRVLKVDIFLTDVQIGPEQLLLGHLAVDLLHDSSPLVEPPLLVVGGAEGAGLGDDLQHTDLADLLADALVAELVVEFLCPAVLHADHAGIELLGLPCLGLHERGGGLVNPIVLDIITHFIDYLNWVWVVMYLLVIALLYKRKGDRIISREGWGQGWGSEGYWVVWEWGSKIVLQVIVVMGRNNKRLDISVSRLIIFLGMQAQHDLMVSKTFVFESQNGLATENLDVSLREDLGEINITQIIDIFRHKNALYQTLSFKIYDPQINHYVPLNPLKPLPRSFMYSPVIMIKYRQSQGHPDSDKDSVVSSKASSDTKRERNRERTIKEVLLYVKQWRQIHNTLDKHKNKINLQDAAKMVGISKKSLDDYFCQLRLAEEHNFDFSSNMDQKIGVLRTFVKKFRPKGDLGVKHERLPKKLKIIENMITEEYRNPNDEEREGEGEERKEEMGQSETIMEAEYEPPMAVIPEDEYENRFYSSFNFTLNDYDDPFLNFGRAEPIRNLEVEPKFALF